MVHVSYRSNPEEMLRKKERAAEMLFKHPIKKDNTIMTETKASTLTLVPPKLTEELQEEPKKDAKINFNKDHKIVSSANMWKDSIDILGAYITGVCSHRAIKPDEIQIAHLKILETFGIAEEWLRKGVLKEKPNHPTAIAPEHSVDKDHIFCLECGKKGKMMTRHILIKHKLTPKEYIDKYDLPYNYPLTAPNLSKRRRAVITDIWKRKKGL